MDIEAKAVVVALEFGDRHYGIKCPSRIRTTVNVRDGRKDVIVTVQFHAGWVTEDEDISSYIPVDCVMELRFAIVRCQWRCCYIKSRLLGFDAELEPRCDRQFLNTIPFCEAQ